MVVKLRIHATGRKIRRRELRNFPRRNHAGGRPEIPVSLSLKDNFDATGRWGTYSRHTSKSSLLLFSCLTGEDFERVTHQRHMVLHRSTRSPPSAAKNWESRLGRQDSEFGMERVVCCAACKSSLLIMSCLTGAELGRESSRKASRCRQNAGLLQGPAKPCSAAEEPCFCWVFRSSAGRKFFAPRRGGA